MFTLTTDDPETHRATGKHEVDEDSEALSACCGASGYAYDDNPMED